MINIDRNAACPASLETQEIKDYIDALQNHLNDPQNVARPKPPGSYRNSDLLEAFDRDFFAKCYLTEEQYANSWGMDVEHFIPQNEDATLRYEWGNLLPASHQANNLKPRTTPNGGYLNPSNPNDDVETEILYAVSAYGMNPDFEAANQNDIRAVNTATLLKRVHNGHDFNTKKSTETLRHAIYKRHVDILNKIIEYQRHPDGSQEKFQAKSILKKLLSRNSSFTMLMRSMTAVKTLPPDFFD